MQSGKLEITVCPAKDCAKEGSAGLDHRHQKTDPANQKGDWQQIKQRHSLV